MPRAVDPDSPELMIRFGRDEEAGKQLIEWATEFCVFWKDQFGTVHFTHYPEDGTWDAIMDRIDNDEIEPV
jgi:hypothetical protein